MTSQKNKFVKLWDLAHFRIERPLKGALAKKYLLIVIPSRNIKDERVHMNVGPRSTMNTNSGTEN